MCGLRCRAPSGWSYGGWPVSRLTDRRDGFVADRLRRRLEGTPARRLMEAEQRLGRLERSMAYRVRLFQGVHVETPKCEIRPDSRGWLAFSSDANLEIDRDPNIVQNHAKWKLSATIPEQGCLAAITTNVDCDATSLTATACGAQVTHMSGNGYVAAQLTGTANEQL